MLQCIACLKSGLFHIRHRLYRYLDTAVWTTHARFVESLPQTLAWGCAAERRNPLLLFLLSGLFLLRLAHRKLSGLLLFHEPPRTQRSNQLNPFSFSHALATSATSAWKVLPFGPPKAAFHCKATLHANVGAESAEENVRAERKPAGAREGAAEGGPGKQNLKPVLRKDETRCRRSCFLGCSCYD